MRIIILPFLLILFCFKANAQDSGIRFFEGSFEQALLKAKSQDKLIFVDAYTTWCGPCKRLKKYVFPDKNVGEFYNKHFINMAIDMEKQEGRAFNMKYPVSAYPTLLFIDSNGELINKSVGGKDIDRFIALGESALKMDDRSERYAEMYEKGNREYDFILKYVKALNRAEKPSSKIVYEYLDSQNDLAEKQKAILIFEAATSCDSRMFEMLTENTIKNLVLKEFGAESYEQKIYDLCWATVQKGLAYDMESLIDEARKKYKAEIKNYKLFFVECDLIEARSKRNASNYLKAAKKRIKYFDEAELKNDFLIEMISLFEGDEKCMEFAKTQSKKILEAEETIDTNFAYAEILALDKKYQEAIPYLDKALELANQEKEYLKAREVMNLKQKIKQKTNKE